MKGPQATLFGTAASVGAVRVYTSKPEIEPAAALSLGAGNHASRLARGFATGGNDTFQARMATIAGANYGNNDICSVFADVSWAATESLELMGRRSNVIDVTSAADANGNALASVTEVPAEIVWNYEAGIKGSAMDNRVTYGLSAFYQNYSDFQVTLQDDAGNFFIANAGSATNLGIEIDVRALFGTDIELFANTAWIDAEIDDDASNGTLAGNRFRLQPEWTASTGLFYDRDLQGSLSLTGALVYSYRSDVFFEPENAPVAGLDISEDAYSLVNLRLGIANRNAGWEVSLFANNLLGEEYLVDAGNTGGSFGNPTFVAGPPLFWGIQLDVGFGS